MLLRLPKDILWKVGPYLSKEDLSCLAKASPERPLWQNTALHALVGGKCATVILPARLEDIAKEEIQRCFLGAGSSHTEDDRSSSLENILLLLHYSELAIARSRQLGGDPNKDQVVWPVGCGSCPCTRGFQGGYPWPLVVLATPRFCPRLLSWAGDAMPREQSQGLLLGGAFLPPERLQNQFQPDENVGVLIWQENDEQFFHPRQRDPQSEDYQLFIQHEMFQVFQTEIGRHIPASSDSTVKGSILWNPSRSMEQQQHRQQQRQHFAHQIMQNKLAQTTACSWLSPKTMEPIPGVPNKHSMCFWIEKMTSQASDNDDSGDGVTKDQKPHEYDSTDFIMKKIRSLMTQITASPPLIVDTSLFQGDWQLTEMYSDEQHAVDFPRNTREVRFVLKVRSSGGSDSMVCISIKIGNSGSTTLTFLDRQVETGSRAPSQARTLLARHSIHSTGVSHTMMYCMALHDMEEFVFGVLGRASLLELLQDEGDGKQKLILSEEGKGGEQYVRLVFWRDQPN